MPNASLYLRIAQAKENKDEETLCQAKEYKGIRVKMSRFMSPFSLTYNVISVPLLTRQPGTLKSF